MTRIEAKKNARIITTCIVIVGFLIACTATSSMLSAGAPWFIAAILGVLTPIAIGFVISIILVIIKHLNDLIEENLR